jgi:hypothetical protein
MLFSWKRHASMSHIKQSSKHRCNVSAPILGQEADIHKADGCSSRCPADLTSVICRTVPSGSHTTHMQGIDWITLYLASTSRRPTPQDTLRTCARQPAHHVTPDEGPCVVPWTTGVSRQRASKRPRCPDAPEPSVASRWRAKRRPCAGCSPWPRVPKNPVIS